MGDLFIIYFFLFLGFYLRRLGWISNKAISFFNNLIIYFFLPLIILLHIPKIQFSLDFLWLSVSPFLIYLGSFIYFKLLKKKEDWSKNMTSVLIMTCGISSVSFVGFPLFKMLYGDEGLALGIVLSVLGTLLVFNTLGLMTAVYGSKTETKLTLWMVVKKLLLFPTFLAFLFAISLNLSQYQLPLALQNIISFLVLPYTAFAFITIGAQIVLKFDFKNLRPILLGLFFKLFVAPLIIFLILWVGMGKHDLIAKICILGSAIGSMNAISILAAKLNIEPEVAMMMATISIPLSIPTVIFIHYLLNLI